MALVDTAPAALQAGSAAVQVAPVRFGNELQKPKPQVAQARLACVDLIRGAAMILMALDHTRDFFTGDTFAPEDIQHTSAPLFFMRFVTHYCAPIFFLLAGSGAYLSIAQGRSVAQVSRFLWTRGLWLAFLDLTVVGFGWTSELPFLFSGVLWTLGWSMVAMAFLIRLPVRWIAFLGVSTIFAHNLLDRVNPSALGKFAGLWMILHGHGIFWVEPHKIYFFVLWPLIPWVGVMAVGYAIGSLLHDKEWIKPVFWIGASAFALFVLLRGFHLYGNSQHRLFGVAAGPWSVQPTLGLTIADFFDTLKYPPSLQFLLMTLGPSLMALAWAAKINPESWLAKMVMVFGRVPLFYYVMHIYVIRTLAVLTAIAFKQQFAWLIFGGYMLNLPPSGYGHGLLFICGIWLLTVAILYPLCKRFTHLKQEHADWWWLRYL